jgi:ATPase family associated with various cellular activities (AAA)
MERTPSAPATAALPAWARELADLYESGATNQFVLFGNTADIFFLPGTDSLGGIAEYLLRALLSPFEVVLSYDPGNGIQVLKGGNIFGQWPALGDTPRLPRNPDEAVLTLTTYFRYVGNLHALGQRAPAVACIVKDADLVLPNGGPNASVELNASAWLVKEWCTERAMAEAHLATFLLVDNLNDLHPLLSGNTRSGRIEVPLPSPAEMESAFARWAGRFPQALSGFTGRAAAAARQLVGATLASVESLLKLQEKRGAPLAAATLAAHKKALVEKDCNGLVEFIESKRTLDDLAGMERIKEWVRQDIALWQKDDLDAIPKGYLLCGPVGTGKTYLVECLAGEAGVPVVKLRTSGWAARRETWRRFFGCSPRSASASSSWTRLTRRWANATEAATIPACLGACTP